MSMDEHFRVSNKSATSKVLVGEGEGDNDHHHHHDNHHSPSPPHDVGDGNGRGPTCNSKPRTSSSTDVYNVIGGVPGAAVAFDSSVSGGLRPLQPFDIGVPADTVTRTTQNIFKSPGGMAASMGFPFTNSQWKELERQAMIYKYMMASVPVPSDLLLPIITSPSLSAAASFGSGLNPFRFSSGGDLEPGRCKRTDGKKWRCSRDVAPDQKYCERHLHRGRPRSRKPVELPPPNNKKKTRLEPHYHSHPLPLPPPIPNSIDSNTNVFTSPSHYLGTMPQTFFSPIESVKEQRCLDWTMKGEPIQMSSSSSQEWHRLMQQTGMGLTAESSFSNACCNLHYGEHSLNLNSYSNFSGSEDQHSPMFPFFINPDLVALEKQHQAEVPRGFIDAWSNGVSDDDHNAHSGAKSCSVSSNGTLPLSPLSLSMGGNNNRFGEEMGQVQMGSSVSDSGQDNECSTKPTLSSWLNPVAWPASTLGGPLAEVLRPSTVTAASDPPSPAAQSGDPGSPPITRLSSPSGVLPKTLASLSDSSGNSSPTLACSRANKPEVSLLWFNQEKL